jgi:hypothetical protein
MAYYTTSALTAAQAQVSKKFNSAELRFRDPVLHKLYIQNNDIMFPTWQELKVSEQRAINAFYKKRSARSLGTAGLTYNHTGNKGDSGTLTPSWTGYTDPFSISLKQGDNNVISHDEMFANEVENMVANFAEGLEGVAATHLFSNRSTANAGVVDGSFDATDKVFKIADTDISKAITIAETNMHINKYNGPYTFVCNSKAWSTFKMQANQGPSNSLNTAFQFSGHQFMHVPELDAKFTALSGSWEDEAWIIVPTGMIGALPWIPKQNIQMIETSVNFYGAFSNPVDGLPYAVHKYEARADQSAAGGYNQDVLTQYQFGLYLAYEHAPQTSGSPLMAFVIEPAVVA